MKSGFSEAPTRRCAQEDHLRGRLPPQSAPCCRPLTPTTHWLWRPASPSADVMSGPGWQESWPGGATSMTPLPPPSALLFVCSLHHPSLLPLTIPSPLRSLFPHFPPYLAPFMSFGAPLSLSPPIWTGFSSPSMWTGAVVAVAANRQPLALIDECSRSDRGQHGVAQLQRPAEELSRSDGWSEETDKE